MVDTKCYETLNFYNFPKPSLQYYAILSLLLSLGSQALLGLVYGPNANQVKRRLSHGSVFNFQIPSLEVDSKADFGDEETRSAGENEIQGRSLSVPQVGRRCSLQSQASHGSHPATPSSGQGGKWTNTDDCNGMISVMGGGNGKVHGLDPASTEGVPLPPVMEDPGKGDLVSKSCCFKYVLHIMVYPSVVGFLGRFLVLVLELGEFFYSMLHPGWSFWAVPFSFYYTLYLHTEALPLSFPTKWVEMLFYHFTPHLSPFPLVPGIYSGPVCLPTPISKICVCLVAITCLGDPFTVALLLKCRTFVLNTYYIL